METLHSLYVAVLFLAVMALFFLLGLTLARGEL